MKVNLARDVLSWEVGKNLETMEGAKGTSEFVLMMNRFEFFHYFVMKMGK